MGMISFSAILAWVYCILAYRDKTAYVVCLSLVLVISLYALLNSIISLHLTKQEDLKKYISDTVNATLANLVPDQEEKQAALDRAIESERLAKATYVQLRKVNNNLTQLAEANSYNSIKSIDNYTALTLSLKEAVTDSISNTAKAIIKYNKTDNQNVIDALNELTTKMQDITIALEDISTRIDSINIVAQPHTKTVLEDSVMDDTLPSGIDVFSMTTSTPKDTAPDITDAEEEAAVNSFFDEFESKDIDEKSDDNTETIKTDSTDANDNQMLSQDAIEALFKAAMPASEVTDENSTAPEPEIAQEPVDVTPAVNDDPNRQLTPDEIAALFSANAPAKEPEVIEEPVDVTPAVNDDPNRQLTPDEIAALFSANAPAKDPEVIEEPVDVAPTVNDDPNRQLTPDEIAALFSASKEERTAKSVDDFHKDNLPEAMDQNLIDALLGNLENEETPTEDKIIPFPMSEEPKSEEAPIAEEFDPNKQLSADEIAALFASINGGN